MPQPTAPASDPNEHPAETADDLRAAYTDAIENTAIIPKIFSACAVAPGTNVIAPGSTVVFRSIYNWYGVVKNVRIGLHEDDWPFLSVGPFTVAGLPLFDGSNQISGSESPPAKNQFFLTVNKKISSQQEVELYLTNNHLKRSMTVGNPTFEVIPRGEPERHMQVDRYETVVCEPLIDPERSTSRRAATERLNELAAQGYRVVSFEACHGSSNPVFMWTLEHSEPRW